MGRLGGEYKSKRLREFEKWLGWLRVAGGQFAGLSPEELVVYQRQAVGEHRYDLLDLAQKYARGKVGRKNYKESVYAAIRSFFLHNRAELPMDRSFHLRGDSATVQGLLQPADIRCVVEGCDILHQAVFLCMFMGGMGEAELVWWSDHGWASLKDQLDAGERIIKVDLPGRKSAKFEKPYYTFLGGDALTALKRWVGIRPRQMVPVERRIGKRQPGTRDPPKSLVENTCIFVNQRLQPLTENGIYANWIRHVRRLGLAGPVKHFDVSNRTGRHLHELRDAFKSQWTLSPSKEVIGEYFLGHTIDPLEYDKSFRQVDAYRAAYLHSLPWLNVISGTRAYRLVEEDEVIALRQKLEEKRRADDEEIRKIVQGMQEEILKLRRQVEEQGR